MFFELMKNIIRILVFPTGLNMEGIKKSKLIDLISSFSTSEWKKLGEFIASPYFNKNDLTIKLYNFLDLYRASFDLSKEEVFQAVFPNMEYDDKKLSYVMSDLLQLSEQFLSVDKFLDDKVQQKRIALTEYVERKLTKHYHFLYRKAMQELDEQKMGPDSLLSKLLFNEIELSFFTKQKIRKYDPSIQETYNSLNEYYYVQLLKNACLLLNWSGVVSGKFEITSISKRLINDLIDEYDNQTPILRIYLSVFQMLSENDDKNGRHFKSLMLLLEEFHHSIDENISRDLYLLGINFCAKKIRKGINEYVSLMLRIYDEGIKNGALLENGYLSHWTYTNVVRLGLKEERYKWVENFIDQYKGLLPPDAFSDAYHLNIADLYFNQQNYDNVLDHLTQLQFSDPSYHLASRLLLIKTFYEREDVEALLSNLASFTIYLKRNKGTSAAYKKTCLNFCTLLHQLLKNKPKKRAELLEQIKTVQPLAERPWLLKVWEEQKI